MFHTAGRLDRPVGGFDFGGLEGDADADLVAWDARHAEPWGQLLLDAQCSVHRSTARDKRGEKRRLALRDPVYDAALERWAPTLPRLSPVLEVFLSFEARRGALPYDASDTDRAKAYVEWADAISAALENATGSPVPRMPATQKQRDALCAPR